MTTLSPLALPFELASQPLRFLEQIRLSAEDEIRAEIQAVSTKPLGLALAGAKFVMEKGQLQVVFPDGIPRGARLMQDKLGRQLPTLIDGKSGRVLAVGRVTTGAKAAGLAASAAVVVVAAASAISDHDNARRLKKIEKDTARLVHAQQSELKARIEAIYRYAREIAGPGTAHLGEIERNEIGRLCLDLMQLRAQWRADFLHEIDRLDTAKADFLSTDRKASYRKNLGKRADHAESVLESVNWMHFTLLLQLALSAKAGRADRFLSITLADEAATWDSLAKHTTRRALEISGKTAMPKQWDPLLDHLRGLAQVWNLETRIPNIQ